MRVPFCGMVPTPFQARFLDDLSRPDFEDYHRVQTIGHWGDRGAGTTTALLMGLLMGAESPMYRGLFLSPDPEMSYRTLLEIVDRAPSPGGVVSHKATWRVNFPDGATVKFSRVSSRNMADESYVEKLMGFRWDYVAIDARPTLKLQGLLASMSFGVKIRFL